MLEEKLRKTIGGETINIDASLCTNDCSDDAANVPDIAGLENHSTVWKITAIFKKTKLS